MQSVEEGLDEADHAMRILHDTRLKEDDIKYATLALLRIFDISFVRIFDNGNQQEREHYLKDSLERIAFAKTFFV